MLPLCWDREEITWLCMCSSHSWVPEATKGDSVLVFNCVSALPHGLPCVSSVSSPNLCCLSQNKWYLPQSRTQSVPPTSGKGMPLCSWDERFLILYVYHYKPHTYSSVPYHYEILITFVSHSNLLLLWMIYSIVKCYGSLCFFCLKVY